MIIGGDAFMDNIFNHTYCEMLIKILHSLLSINIIMEPLFQWKTNSFTGHPPIMKLYIKIILELGKMRKRQRKKS